MLYLLKDAFALKGDPAISLLGSIFLLAVLIVTTKRALVEYLYNPPFYKSAFWWLNGFACWACFYVAIMLSEHSERAFSEASWALLPSAVAHYVAHFWKKERQDDPLHKVVLPILYGSLSGFVFFFVLCHLLELIGGAFIAR